MRDLLAVPEDWEQPLQETTALRDDWRPKAVMDYLDRLLGVLPGDYDDGRVSTERSFTFDRAEYEQLLRGLREHYKKRVLLPQPVRTLLRLFGLGSPTK